LSIVNSRAQRDICIVMKDDVKEIPIALAEDNPVNRQSFMQKMQRFKHIKILFIANNGNDFLQQMKGLPPHKLPPVAFIDLEMPEMNGIDTITIGKNLYPTVHFLVLTVFEDDDKIFEAIKAGASGYLLKHETDVMLLDAISEVLEYGGAPMSPAIARKTLRLLGQTTKKEDTAKKDAMLDNLLSEREQEVLQHLINGYDAKRIASIIKISTLTVRKHVANIYNKLHVNSKAQVLSLAHKNNWLK
jgi:DNA-binding NarL/FixJ family response regulator